MTGRMIVLSALLLLTRSSHLRAGSYDLGQANPASFNGITVFAPDRPGPHTASSQAQHSNDLAQDDSWSLTADITALDISDFVAPDNDPGAKHGMILRSAKPIRTVATSTTSSLLPIQLEWFAAFGSVIEQCPGISTGAAPMPIVFESERSETARSDSKNWFSADPPAGSPSESRDAAWTFRPLPEPMLPLVTFLTQSSPSLAAVERRATWLERATGD